MSNAVYAVCGVFIFCLSSFANVLDTPKCACASHYRGAGGHGGGHK